MRFFKPVLFLLCLIPLLALSYRAYSGTLSANPIKDITEETGTWTLRFLVATLAVTPLRRLGWNGIIRYRRMIGLFAFFYACLHFTTYIWLDQFFDFQGMLADVAKRPFITAGFTAFVMLIPLAVTSTKKMIRRLGGKRWQVLHRLIYVAAVAGVIHYLWLVKADTRRPITYGVIVAFLLGFRVWKYSVKARRVAPVKEPLLGRNDA